MSDNFKISASLKVSEFRLLISH